MTGMTTHTFFGLSEPVLNIVFHPLQPTIYTICKNSLHKWTSAERLRSFCSIPTNMLIKYNKDNYVKSEEFDLLTEEDVEKQLNDVNKKQIAIVDFMINDDKEFSDDDLFPNQMKILPFEEENE